MLFKRTAIISLSTLFFTVGCVTISTDQEAQKIKTTLQDQATKISDLESALIVSEANIQEKKTTLAQTQSQLEKAEQDKIALNEQLKIKEQKLKEIVPVKPIVITNTVVAKAPQKTAYQDKTVLGQTEWIYITKAKENFKARIDTGAETSSINAIDIQKFERDGKNWVKFNITHDSDGSPLWIEAPVLRYVRILQSSEGEKYDRRPVIELHVRIGGVAHKSEFTLTDRQHMGFPVLIGRSFIQDVIVVDVSQNYIHPKYQEQDKK
jgi:hypothetical protein